MAGTLGVATIAYLPYCFLNIFNPVISLIYGLTGFQVKRIDEPTATPLSEAEPPSDVSTQKADVDDQDLRKTA